MPAYNAEKTLKKTYDAIPKNIVDEIILTDDASKDETAKLSRDLEIKTLRKANPSKKIAKLKKAISPTQLVFNGYVKKGITILKSLQKQRRNFLNLYIDMVADENLARKGTEDKQFKKYMLLRQISG